MSSKPSPSPALEPKSDNPKRIPWLALALTPGLGPTRSKRTVEYFGGIEGVFQVSLTELESAGLPAAAAQSIGTGKSLELAHEEAAKASALGVHLLTLDDPEYPSRLRQIYDPPIVLYVRGSTEPLERPGIAVIGTRHPTPYGVGMAERLSCDLAARGLVIVSGLARGVDTAAHRGVISGKRQDGRGLRYRGRCRLSQRELTPRRPDPQLRRRTGI